MAFQGDINWEAAESRIHVLVTSQGGGLTAAFIQGDGDHRRSLKATAVIKAPIALRSPR